LEGGSAMPVTESPLRYPGGKTKLYSKVKKIIDAVLMKEDRIYIEPYAGGAGLALKLLYNDDVEKIILNDLDYHIYCFWRSCIDETEALCNMIRRVEINIEEWNRQKDIYANTNEHTVLQIGFSTFFLNRCNVSGIINGGPIGGNDQKGAYKLDARFNKDNLIKKIKKVASYKEKIILYNLDAVDFLVKVVPQYSRDHIFLNIDPPYVKKGPLLYKNSYTYEDHKSVSEQVKKIKAYWIVTYDACDTIKELYKEFVIEDLELSYSAGKTKKGKEYIIYSKLIKVGNTND
jgi:DNA adenine methylase